MESGAKKEHMSKCTTTRKKTRFPKASTAKIFELLEIDPSFSGISGDVDSGKSTYVNKGIV